MSWFGKILDEIEKGSNVGVTIGSLVTIAVAGLAAWGVRNLLSLGSLATLVVAGLAARGVSSLLSKLKSNLTSKKKKREREKMISWFLGIGNNSQSDEKEKNEEGSNVVVAIGSVAMLVVAGLAAWGVSSLLSGLSSNVGVTFRSLATIIVAALAAWGVSSLLSRLKSILISKKNKREKEKNEEGSNVGVAIGSVAALAVAGLAAWGVSSLLSSTTTENEDKKMKAPGKPDQLIPRANFENNTREYFRDLRQTKRNERS